MDVTAKTTDEIADTIRQRVLAYPAAAITCAPGVEQLVGILTDRLPYVSTDDVGAVTLIIGCWLADAMETMRGPGGLSAHAAGQLVTDIVTLTGEQLYTSGQRAAQDRRNGGGS